MKRFIEEFDLAMLKQLAPYLILSALLSAVLVMGVLLASGQFQGRSGRITVAVFDVVKFANAQRALASTFIGNRDTASEAGVLLMALSEKTTAAIEKIAGSGTLVMVKQGVVSGTQQDITDAVLRELGLPTNIPTADPMKYLLDIAPTTLALPSRQNFVPEPQTETPASNSKVLP